MEHGSVTTVNYKDGVVYCSVRALRVNTEYRDVPVMKSHSGFIEVPEQGDIVAMDSLKDGTRFIQDVISTAKEVPDNVEEGELIVQLDKDTQASFRKTDDGKYNCNISASGELNLEANGTVSLKAGKELSIDSETEINIEAIKALSLKASENITVDAGSKVKIQGIPFKDHTHGYSWTDSGGSDTTDPPQ